MDTVTLRLCMSTRARRSTTSKEPDRHKRPLGEDDNQGWKHLLQWSTARILATLELARRALELLVRQRIRLLRQEPWSIETGNRRSRRAPIMGSRGGRGTGHARILKAQSADCPSRAGPNAGMRNSWPIFPESTKLRSAVKWWKCTFREARACGGDLQPDPNALVAITRRQESSSAPHEKRSRRRFSAF